MPSTKRGEMPAEKFYPTAAVEGEPSDNLEVAWHRDYTGVYLTLVTATGSAHAVDLDRSGLNRLIKTLRKARDQTHGRDE